jgi:hypothetical protein
MRDFALRDFIAAQSVCLDTQIFAPGCGHNAPRVPARSLDGKPGREDFSVLIIAPVRYQTRLNTLVPHDRWSKHRTCRRMTGFTFWRLGMTGLCQCVGCTNRARWFGELLFARCRCDITSDHPAASHGRLENGDLSIICDSSDRHAVFLQLASGGVIRYPMLGCGHRRLVPCD